MTRTLPPRSQPKATPLRAPLLLTALTCLATPALANPGAANSPAEDARLAFHDADRRAPVDYGAGPGVARAAAVAHQPPKVPNGGPNAATAGAFGKAAAWPIIPIHMVVLPDGRVMNYGTDQHGTQGAQFLYDVWDPAVGTGTDAHLILPNTTSTDIYCSAQTVLWGSGEVLITGGDLTINNKRAYSQNLTELFAPATGTLSANTPMQYPRWYPSVVPLSNGEIAVIGGRRAPSVPEPVPEVYSPGTGWRTLTGASSDAAYGNAGYNWYYPRGFQIGGGKVFILATDGSMHLLDPSGTGSVAAYAQTAPAGSMSLPTLMYQPGKLLSVRNGGQVVTVDTTGAAPVVTPTASLPQDRFWSNATLMADGRVLVTGGSSVLYMLTGSDYEADIWDPATGLWTAGANAAVTRLLHSTALLLPDATVITAGGGAPGPVNNLNAEIYYPPYLYLKDGTGRAAPRPHLSGAPGRIAPGQSFSATAGAGDKITQVTFVRAGSATHAVNFDQRFLALSFQQKGTVLTIQTPSGTDAPLSGNYMLFAFNKAGVPSVAQIVTLAP